jgi:DNA polymerase-3 subunit epsilon
MRKPYKVLWFDLETTGTEHWRHGITQMAGMVEINGEIMDEFNILIEPDDSVQIEDEALEISGTTREEISEHDSELDAYDQMINVFERYIDRYDTEDKFWVGGYNCQFDIDFLGQFWDRNQRKNQYLGSYLKRSHVLDPYAMVNVLVFQGTIEPLDNHQLGTVAKRFGLHQGRDFHDAMTDIRVTRELFHELVDPNADYRT